jgi:energy-converting hydrogenase Eha subunit A
MKNYKMVDPTPVQAGGFGAIAGASIGATSVAGALIGGAVGFASGAIAGGIVARKDRMMAKEENPGLRNPTQLGKYGK